MKTERILLWAALLLALTCSRQNKNGWTVPWQNCARTAAIRC